MSTYSDEKKKVKSYATLKFFNCITFPDFNHMAHYDINSGGIKVST